MRPLTPDMYAVAAVAGAVIAEWLFPVGGAPGLGAPLTWVGIVIAIAGFALEFAAARALAAAGTTTRANGEPQILVTTGPFAVSRNPFYIGLLLVLAGGFLAVGLEWGILFTAVVWLTLDRFVIPREEAKLRAIAPEDFARYSGSVRRWL